MSMSDWQFYWPGDTVDVSSTPEISDNNKENHEDIKIVQENVKSLESALGEVKNIFCGERLSNMWRKIIYYVKNDNLLCKKYIIYSFIVLINYTQTDLKLVQIHLVVTQVLSV